MKTAELIGLALDWAVDKTRNLNTPYNSWGQVGKVPAYSTDWAHGGPIIESEKIGVVTLPDDANFWVGSIDVPEWEFNRTGPTPLVAAMRCYVASKMGDKIEIPKELK